MFEQLLTIVRNTFTESIRQPVYVVLVLTGSLALVFAPSLSSYTFTDDNRMMIDMGLSTLLLMGLLLAAFTATGVISKELENKTVLTVVSKPVPKPLFITGKYLGVAGAIALAFWVLTVVFLFAERHGVMTTVREDFDGPVLLLGTLSLVVALGVATFGNYMYGWPFTSTFMLFIGGLMTASWGLVLVLGKGFVLQSPATDFEPQLMAAVFMVFQTVLILTAVAVATSTRAGQIVTLLICLGVMFLCLNTGFAFGRYAEDNLLAAALFYLLPNFQFLWMSDALHQGHHVPASHLALVTGYTTVYVLCLLGVAVALFQTRDVS